jgi:DNA-binding transcriptional ArsR family regulator
MIDSPLTRIFFALSEPRTKIYTMCLKEKLNISEITRRVGFTYQMIMKHLEILEKAGMIKKEEDTQNGVRVVLIKSIPFKKDTIYESVYEARLKELEKN